MTPFAAARQAVAPHDMTGRLPYLRAALERGRRFRIDQLEELATTAAAGSTLPSDEPRNQIAVVLQQAASAALSDIDAALHRLARGVYGKCEQCGTAIPLERLEVLPMLRLCIGCQHAKKPAGSNHRFAGDALRGSPR
ncbi:MAG: TraR/DksA C4-type zinc finger protein [Geodermatophilaceae bacterium]